MTGNDLLRRLEALPAETLRRDILVVLHDYLPGDTFTEFSIGRPDERDIDLSRDPESTADALMLRIL